MAAAQAGEERGIVAKRILSSAGEGRYAGVGRCGGKQGCRCGGGCADGDAVQEVAARDGAVHAEARLPVRGTTCQPMDTVYNDSHCLHIQVTP